MSKQYIPKRILAVSLGGIGDTVLFSPVLHALNKKWPTAQITLLCSNKPVARLYETSPGITETVCVNTNRTGLIHKFFAIHPFIRANQKTGQPFSIAVFAAGLNPKLATLLKHTLRIPDAYTTPPLQAGETDLYRNIHLAHHIDRDISADDVFIPITPSDRKETQTWMAAHALNPEAPLLAVYPSIDRPNRPRWPLSRMMALIQTLKKKYPKLQVVIVGGSDEQNEWKTIDTQNIADGVAAGTLSISGTAALLEHATLALCNDGGLMHIAGAMQTPTVCVMPNAPTSYCPPGKQTFMIPSDTQPVLYPNRISRADWIRCAEGINSETVYHACQKLLHPK